MISPFVHLRLHSEYSLVDSVVRVPALMDRVAELGMPAVALTDTGNLFALIKFYRGAEARGIKPIIGADLAVLLEGEERAGTITVLVCNRDGYRTLCELITRSYTEGQNAGRAEVRAEWFGTGAPGLIALAGRESPLGRAFAGARAERARKRLERLHTLFPQGVYLELTRTGLAGEESFNQAAVALALETGTTPVATNNVRFLRPEDYEAHEARVAIHQGYRLNEPGRSRFYSPEQYLKSVAEMNDCFADLPEALEASVGIAERASLELDLGRTILPAFPLPNGEDEAARLRSDAENGLARRLANPAATASRQADYRARLAQELEIIIEMGFSGYFLIVADFINWAREHAVPVGPGRGSGAGSLVAYSLNITDIDPIVYELIFERFLNPERVSMPDFDVDFCMEGRDRVIDYVAERYGRDRVSQIITYGSMAARAVVRDVGRVLGHPYGYVDKIAKMVPFEIGMTLDKALVESAELKQTYDSQEEVRTLIDLARKLEGLARNAGKHAGGVVIAPTPLTDFTPLYAEANGASPVTQLDKDDVEAMGLVKFDFLGLRTLTILDWAAKAINAQRGETDEAPLDISALPLDDTETYEQVFKNAQTVGVFQFESAGMQRLLKEAKPDRFEDLVALNALFRPGPMDLIPSFLARKCGRDAVKYPDPRVAPILKETYGIMVYQEQVMQMAQIVGGYTLGGADLLRRAMGKKKPEEMARHRAIFREGAARHGLPAEKADHIFDLMEKFAGYGFNKSHSVAYALLAYQTAWMKVHYPAAYMAAVLSADMDHTDKIVNLINECRRMRLAILPPDVNRSDYPFVVEGTQAIRYGLGAIKGLGRAAVEALVAGRAGAGPYRDLGNLCVRADPTRLNRRAFEALIEAGALDDVGTDRAALMSELPRALAAADQRHRAGVTGQVDLFGIAQAPALPHVTPQSWDERERLTREKRALGLYLSGHPMNRYAALLPCLGIGRIGGLVTPDEPDNGGFSSSNLRVAGLIVELRRFGRRTAITLDDGSGRIEAIAFEDVAESSTGLLIPDSIVVVDGRLGYDDYFNRWRVTATEITAIETIAEREAGCLWIDWRSNGTPPQKFMAGLKEALSAHRGGTTVVNVRYRGTQASACLQLGSEWRVAVHDDLLAGIERLGEVERVEVVYRRNPIRSKSGDAAYSRTG